jgi:hypothetical protein
MCAQYYAHHAPFAVGTNVRSSSFGFRPLPDQAVGSAFAPSPCIACSQGERNGESPSHGSLTRA